MIEKFQPTTIRKLKLKNIIKEIFPFEVKDVFIDKVKINDKEFYRRVAVKPIKEENKDYNFKTLIDKINEKILPKGFYIYEYRVSKMQPCFYLYSGYVLSMKMKEIDEDEFRKLKRGRRENGNL